MSVAKPTSVRDIQQGREDVWKIDPRVIKVKDGWNCRIESPESKEKDEELARSIFKIGFLKDKPVTVVFEDGSVYLTDGHRRHRATLKAIEMGADIKLIPAVTEPRGTNDADRVAGMLTRNSGLPLTPLEQGGIYKRLIAFGWDEKQIADTSGKSITHVKSILDLMTATPETHAAIVAGTVGASTVAKVVREHGPAKAAKAVAKAVETAKSEGKNKATDRDVNSVARKDGTGKKRSLSEVMDFFRVTVKEGDGPDSVIRISQAIIEFQDGRYTPEKFMENLSKIVSGK